MLNSSIFFLIGRLSKINRKEKKRDPQKKISIRQVVRLVKCREDKQNSRCMEKYEKKEPDSDNAYRTIMLAYSVLKNRNRKKVSQLEIACQKEKTKIKF